MNPEIYREIKRRILFMEYAPGQILNENVLAKEFGVSRTPMREALLRLELEGFVVIKPRSGIRVRRLTEQDIRNLYQMIGDSATEATLAEAVSFVNAIESPVDRVAAIQTRDEACSRGRNPPLR